MKSNEVISYILENSLEREVKFNFINKNRLLIDIMGKSPVGNIYNFNKKLKFVYLKNFCFDNCSRFKFDDNTLVIFDNCHFDGNNIYFNGGQIQIINSSFDFLAGEVNILLNRVVDFDFVSNTWNDGLVGPYLCFYGESCGKFSVYGNNNSYKFMVSADSCCLDSVKNLDVFNFNAEKMKIVNCDLLFSKKEVNYTIVDACGQIDVKDLLLSNVHIDVGDSILFMTVENLSGNDYEIRFDYALKLGNFYYFNKGKDAVVWSSERELNGRVNFIKILKYFILNKKQLINDETYCDDNIMVIDDAILDEEVSKFILCKKKVKDL